MHIKTFNEKNEIFIVTCNDIDASNGDIQHSHRLAIYFSETMDT